MSSDTDFAYRALDILKKTHRYSGLKLSILSLKFSLQYHSEADQHNLFNCIGKDLNGVSQDPREHGLQRTDLSSVLFSPFHLWDLNLSQSCRMKVAALVLCQPASWGTSM